MIGILSMLPNVLLKQYLAAKKYY